MRRKERGHKKFKANGAFLSAPYSESVFMKIHEYQAKQILGQYDIPVPRGIAAFTAQEALEAAQKIGGNEWMVKAQIHAGGRGKAGGIKKVSTPAQVQEVATQMLGMQLVTPQTGAQGQMVRRLLIEECTEIVHEYYLSIIIDRQTQKILFMASAHGGVDIEEVAKKTPDQITKVAINPLRGIDDEQGRQLAIGLGLPQANIAQAVHIIKQLYQVFIDKDASLVEVNPLVLNASGGLTVLDVKCSFDDNALFRQPDIFALRDLDEEAPEELEASKYGLSYVGLDGDIACLVNGAGLAMATMDTIKHYGGEPANFLDVGGGATEEKVTAAFGIMLKNPKVNAILVNIFGGIMHCDVIAAGIIAACNAVSLNVPLVVRMKGTHEAQGKAALAASGLPIVSVSGMAEAAQQVVAAARKAKENKGCSA